MASLPEEPRKVKKYRNRTTGKSQRRLIKPSKANEFYLNFEHSDAILQLATVSYQHDFMEKYLRKIMVNDLRKSDTMKKKYKCWPPCLSMSSAR